MKGPRAKFGRWLRQSQRLPPQSRLLLAISGGQDSLALAQLLHWHRPRWQWAIVWGHGNHRLRPDADACAAHLAQLATQWGYPFVASTADCPLPSEAAARQWRYQALLAMARAHDCPYILTAHTRSDRAETFLLQLWRGASPGGLRAILPQRPLGDRWLIRPLLPFSRAETGALCRQQRLPVWVDPTNQHLGYRRNRLRQRVIPYLQRHFNPQLETRLSQTADLWHEDNTYLESLAAPLWQPGQPLRCPVLQSQPLALQRRVLRSFLQTHTGRFPTYRQIVMAIALLSAPPGTRSENLPGGSWLTVQSMAAAERVLVWQSPRSFTP
ncbi:MAG TPA: tRNA lysidine(34) synthetase TilS [Cyanobacteria bacterium UBA8156]|jgi:tRNA(Ile)-lysidine synthase|nr:tRNA lysidine(34) synthetase TilS [Cyanobacteria bacterium UBA8156]